MKRISLAALALIVGALVIAGCGGGSSSSGGSTESTTTASTGSTGGSEGSKAKGGMAEISAEAKACLKEKGVELPEFKSGEGGPPAGGSGGTGEGGEPPEGFEPPEGGELPEGAEGGSPTGEAPGGEKFEEQKAAFEECGVEIGAGFAGGPGGAGKPNTNSAAFKKQVKEYVACVRENGYELAEPNFSGEGPVFEKAESESAEFKQASESCQSLLGGPQGSQSG
jgi:hypothetical protein